MKLCFAPQFLFNSCKKLAQLSLKTAPQLHTSKLHFIQKFQGKKGQQKKLFNEKNCYMQLSDLENRWNFAMRWKWSCRDAFQGGESPKNHVVKKTPYDTVAIIKITFASSTNCTYVVLALDLLKQGKIRVFSCGEADSSRHGKCCSSSSCCCCWGDHFSYH